jgi:hypothetical protein
MADVITANFSHTYAGLEFTQSLFYQPEENVPSVASLYNMHDVPGDKKNVYLPLKLRKILRKYTTCGFTATGGVSTIDDVTISVEKIKANLEECVDTWDDTIFAEMMKKGIQRDDLSNTIIDQVIRRQVDMGLKSDIHRMVWFADSDDADNDWKQFDGFISLFLDASASIGASCFIDMDSTSFETGDALATDGALGLLRQIWEAQSATLRATSNKQFYVTHTVADNLRTSLENVGTDSGLARIEAGDNGLRFRGVPIVEVPEWDVNLADATNPHYTGSGLSIGSNLIVYTTPDNLVVGSDVSSPEAQVKFRYNDDDDEKMKVVSKFKLGVQIIHAELICLAY